MNLTKTEIEQLQKLRAKVISNDVKLRPYPTLEITCVLKSKNKVDRHFHYRVMFSQEQDSIYNKRYLRFAVRYKTIREAPTKTTIMKIAHALGFTGHFSDWKFIYE